MVFITTVYLDITLVHYVQVHVDVVFHHMLGWEIGLSTVTANRNTEEYKQAGHHRIYIKTCGTARHAGKVSDLKHVSINKRHFRSHFLSKYTRAKP